MHILPGRPAGKPDQMSPIHAAVPTDVMNLELSMDVLLALTVVISKLALLDDKAAGGPTTVNSFVEIAWLDDGGVVWDLLD